MSAQASGKKGKNSKGKNGKPRDEAAVATGTVVMPTSPAALERAIAERRDHLAATLDELTARAQPKAIARRGAASVQEKVRALTHTPEGQLRTERLAAVAGAVVVLAGTFAYLRRRRS
jgi:hypothetical protein